MNTKKIVGGIGVIALLACAIFVTPNLLSNHNKNSQKQTRIENEQKESFNDAAKYLWSMRVNPATGKIDISEVEAARQQVEAMAAGNKANRMQSGTFDFGWQELGPDNVGGRTRAILFDKTDPTHQRMFAGGVSGGLWRSTDHGQSWNKIDDEAQNLCVSCITQAANGDIYYGTGNGFDVILADGNSGFYGQGVWKSTDGGNTFNRLASTWTTLAQQGTWEIVNNIYADPTNPSRIYAATNKGLQMTKDGGLTWTNPVRLNMVGGQINSQAQTVKVASDGTVLCAVNNQLYISPNGNDSTFSKITSVPSKSRVEVAIAPSNPNVMYAIVTYGVQNGNGLYNVYRSTDKFQTATVIGPGQGSWDPFQEPTSAQGWYDIGLAVAPDNQNKLFLVGISAWKWELGNNWTQMNGFFMSNTIVHPDMHTVIFDPSNPADFFIGTDGGLYESQDQGLTFAAMNRKYNVTQFYSCAPSAVQGTHDIIGGTQDNNCLYISGLGNTVQDAQAILGGDGFYTAISYYNPLAFFSEAQYGSLFRSANKGTSSDMFYDSRLTNLGMLPNFSSFNTPYLLWENVNPNTPLDTSFFIGIAGSVWMTKGAIDFSNTPKWYEIATTQSPARCMAITNDGKTLFVGTEGTNYVYRISHLDYVNNNIDTTAPNYDLTTGTAITKLNLSGMPGTVPTSISVDPMNNNHVIITFGSYSSGLKHVIQSHNALNAIPTWTDITHNIPMMPVYSSMIDRWDSTRMLVGTELGVFASDDGGATWNYQDQFPRVPSFMIKQISQYTNGAPAEDIYVATHGRGLWKSSTLTGINTIAANNKPQISIYPNPTSDNANIQYSLKKSLNVIMDIYNIKGEKVKSVNLGTQSSGAHQFNINITDISSGTYFMNATMGEDKSVTKFVIAR